MKGYLIDAQTRSIHRIEVAGFNSCKHLIGPNCKGLVEMFQFSNGDAVFKDACGLYGEFPDGKNRPENMGLITSDMFYDNVFPFFSRVLVLGVSEKSAKCKYDSDCDAKSTEEFLHFWTRFFTNDEGFNWLSYNYMVE